MFAVIKTGGKQYKVAKDDRVTVERLAAEAGETVTFDEVLILGGSDGAPIIGTPIVEGASVSAEVVEQARGDKIIVFKKKRRHNYRRKKGHRQDLTVVRILEISAKGGVKATRAAKTSAKSETKPAAVKTGGEPERLSAPRGKADKLADMTGVGPKIVEKLHGIGIFHFSQIAAWTPENVAWVDKELDLKGRIERDGWVAQAKKLLKD